MEIHPRHIPAQIDTAPFFACSARLIEKRWKCSQSLVRVTGICRFNRTGNLGAEKFGFRARIWQERTSESQRSVELSPHHVRNPRKSTYGNFTKRRKRRSHGFVVTAARGFGTEKKNLSTKSKGSEKKWEPIFKRNIEALESILSRRMDQVALQVNVDFRNAPEKDPKIVKEKRKLLTKILESKILEHNVQCRARGSFSSYEMSKFQSHPKDIKVIDLKNYLERNVRSLMADSQLADSGQFFLKEFHFSACIHAGTCAVKGRLMDEEFSLIMGYVWKETQLALQEGPMMSSQQLAQFLSSDTVRKRHPEVTPKLLARYLAYGSSAMGELHFVHLVKVACIISCQAWLQGNPLVQKYSKRWNSWRSLLLAELAGTALSGAITAGKDQIDFVLNCSFWETYCGKRPDSLEKAGSMLNFEIEEEFKMFLMEIDVIVEELNSALMARNEASPHVSSSAEILTAGSPPMGKQGSKLPSHNSPESLESKSTKKAFLALLNQDILEDYLADTLDNLADTLHAPSDWLQGAKSMRFEANKLSFHRMHFEPPAWLDPQEISFLRSVAQENWMDYGWWELAKIVSYSVLLEGIQMDRWMNIPQLLVFYSYKLRSDRGHVLVLGFAVFEKFQTCLGRPSSEWMPWVELVGGVPILRRSFEHFLSLSLSPIRSAHVGTVLLLLEYLDEENFSGLFSGDYNEFTEDVELQTVLRATVSSTEKQSKKVGDVRKVLDSLRGQRSSYELDRFLLSVAGKYLGYPPAPRVSPPDSQGEEPPRAEPEKSAPGDKEEAGKGSRGESASSQTVDQGADSSAVRLPAVQGAPGPKAGVASGDRRTRKARGKRKDTSGTDKTRQDPAGTLRAEAEPSQDPAGPDRNGEILQDLAGPGRTRETVHDHAGPGGTEETIRNTLGPGRTEETLQDRIGPVENDETVWDLSGPGRTKDTLWDPTGSTKGTIQDHAGPGGTKETMQDTVGPGRTVETLQDPRGRVGGTVQDQIAPGENDETAWDLSGPGRTERTVKDPTRPGMVEDLQDFPGPDGTNGAPSDFFGPGRGDGGTVDFSGPVEEGRREDRFMNVRTFDRSFSAPGGLVRQPRRMQPPEEEGGEYFYILDTNVLMNQQSRAHIDDICDTSASQEFARANFVVPSLVFKELENLKFRKVGQGFSVSDKKNAMAAFEWYMGHLKRNTTLIHPSKPEEFVQPHPTREGDHNDDGILGVAMYYHHKYPKKAYFVTLDKALKLKARAHCGLRVLTSPLLIELVGNPRKKILAGSFKERAPSQ